MLLFVCARACVYVTVRVRMRVYISVCARAIMCTCVTVCVCAKEYVLRTAYTDYLRGRITYADYLKDITIVVHKYTYTNLYYIEPELKL